MSPQLLREVSGVTDEITRPKRAILESYVAVSDGDWNRAEMCALALLGSIRYHRAQDGQTADSQEVSV